MYMMMILYRYDEWENGSNSCGTGCLCIDPLFNTLGFLFVGKHLRLKFYFKEAECLKNSENANGGWRLEKEESR